MNARPKPTWIALMSVALLASPLAVAQTAGGSPPGGVAQSRGAPAGQPQDGAAARGRDGSKSGSLMQKRQQGMSAEHPASSPDATGKMSQ